MPLKHGYNRKALLTPDLHCSRFFKGIFTSYQKNLKINLEIVTDTSHNHGKSQPKLFIYFVIDKNDKI
jgi:hypothetical protein